MKSFWVKFASVIVIVLLVGAITVGVCNSDKTKWEVKQGIVTDIYETDILVYHTIELETKNGKVLEHGTFLRYDGGPTVEDVGQLWSYND